MHSTTLARITTIPPITNGSTIVFGQKYRQITIIVDQHFNWFQKLMWKWCFGAVVTDYKE